MRFGLIGGMLILMFAFLSSAQATPTLDLTTAGASGFINGAYFQQGGDGAAGSGKIMSFVRIQTNDPIEQGYNTDYRPIQTGFQVNTSLSFTHHLLLSTVAIVNKDGIDYREFRLDINEGGGSHSKLSLDSMQIYLASAGDLHSYPNLGTKIFDLDSPTVDHWILLDAALGGGSGKEEDMFAYIPDNLFVGGDYVYLYSKFGASENSAYPNNSGYEEWSVMEVTPPLVPAPGALLLVLLGSPLTLWFRRCQRA